MYPTPYKPRPPHNAKTKITIVLSNRVTYTLFTQETAQVAKERFKTILKMESILTIEKTESPTQRDYFLHSDCPYQFALVQVDKCASIEIESLEGQ